MHLTNISGSNFKGFSGRDFEFDLKPLTVIIGPNFGCKTSILDAVTVLLLGYHPKLGKVNNKTWQLAGSGPSMQLSGVFDTGVTVNHSWRMDAKGTVTKKGGVPDSLEIPTELVSIREFFGRSAVERTQFLFERVTMPTFDFDSLHKAVSAIEVLPTPISGPIVAALAASFAKAYKAAMDSKVPLPKWLADYIEILKSKKKDASALASVAASSLLGLRQQMIPKCEDVTPKLTLVREKHSRLLKTLTGYQTIQSLHQTMLVKQQALQQRIATIVGSAEDVATLKADIAELEAKAAEIQCETCGSPRVAWRNEKALAEHPEDQSVSQGITALRSTLDDVEAGQRERQQLQAALDSIVIPPAPAPIDNEVIEKELAEVEAEVRTLMNQNQAYGAYVNHKANLTRSEEQQVARTVEVEVLKLMLDLVVAAQERVLNEAVDALLSVAARFTDDILPANLCYSDGDIGMQRDGRFVSYATFSGAEETLAFAGLAVALCQQSPFKFVMIDEFGRFLGQNQIAVLDRMHSLIAEGVIDQCLIAGFPPGINLPPFVHAIDLGSAVSYPQTNKTQ